jgi:hypothetical protein
VSKSLAFFDASSISRIFSYPKSLITSLRRRKGPEKVGRLSSKAFLFLILGSNDEQGIG